MTSLGKAQPPGSRSPQGQRSAVPSVGLVSTGDVAPSVVDSSFRIGTSPAVLGGVVRPGVDVCLWKRDLPTAFTRALDAWAASTDAPPFDSVVAADTSVVSEAFSQVPMAIRAPLLSDASMLLAHFRGLTRVEQCRLFFGVVRNDRCRKFHVDAVAMRMVVTYVGPGTEWVPEANVDRAALARMIECPSEANAAIVRDDRAVRRAERGDVLILKGSRHPGAGGRGAVHRSPPIEHGGQHRVVLIATAGGPAQ